MACHSLFFLLYGTTPGDAGNITRRILARKGGHEVGYFKTLGLDTYFGYIKEGYLFSAEHPTASETDAARVFGTDIAERIDRREFIQEPYDRPASPWERFERFMTNRWFANTIYRWMFSVISMKCSSCGKCVKACPTGNIAMNHKGLPSWGNNCILCFYCEMNCPTGAIRSLISQPWFTPLVRYDIWRHVHGHASSYVRVVHTHGQTRRAE